MTTAIDVRKDLETATFTVAAEYRSTRERLWRLWADPRQLERWWGPPSHPATIVDHDLTPGGIVTYYMTGPEGEKYRGGWRVLRVEEPHQLEMEDYFADENGVEDTSMPLSRFTVTFEDVGDGRARMTIVTRYDSVEAMEKVVEMGVEEGIKQALGQIDGILAEEAA